MGEVNRIVTAPIFPLPNVVLPPGSALPLHIFEPRYRAMLTWALAHERLIAIALWDLHRPPGPDGTPAIHGVLGLGKIIDHEPLADGRSDIVLRGVARCRVLAEDRSHPFRLGRLETIPPSARDPSEARALTSMLTARLGLQNPLPAETPAACSEVADRVLQVLPLDVLTRQSVFATLDVSGRLRALHRLVDGFSGAGSPERN